MVHGKQIRRKSIKGEKLRFDGTPAGTVLVVKADGTADVATGITYSIEGTTPVITVDGKIVGDVKHFDITHPDKADMRLIHTCLEGPEVAVYYRGEATTDFNGKATIKLPDYFESLTHTTGRTVLLTPMFTDFSDLPLPMAYSPILNGMFSVTTLTGNKLQRFSWEVKALRADKPIVFESEISK
jgi:hypothetical protein